MIYTSDRPTFSLPPNNTLIGLPTLLDVAAVREQLNAAGAQVENGQVVYRWYKPDSNCIVAYRFQRTSLATGEFETAFFYGKCFTSEAYPAARKKALGKRWVEQPAGPAFIPLDSAAALLYAFPNDAEMRGLSLLGTQRKLRRFLQAQLVDYPFRAWRLPKKSLSTEIVRYKPERRAVFRFRAKTVNRQTRDKEKVLLYWRVDRASQTEEISRRMCFLKDNLPESGDLIVPRAMGFDSDSRVLVMEALAGQPLVEVLQTGQAAAAVERTGAALAHLHTLADTKLPSGSPADFLRKASESRGALAALSPELASLAYLVFAKLQDTMPESGKDLTLVHGDFYYDQVLIGPERVGFIDFDRSHIGSRFTDLGSFLAYLKFLTLENRLTYPDAIDRRFLETYSRIWGEDPQTAELRWWTALSLLLFAVVPFHTLAPNWPEMVRAILEAARDELC